jgi:hypothetical protein
MSVSARLRLERKAISEQMRTLLTSTSPNAAEQWRTLDAAQSALEVRINSIELDGVERDLSNNSNRPPIGNEYDGMERTLNASDQARSTPAAAFGKWVRLLADKVKPLSQRDRFVIAMHSPSYVVETGLRASPTERKAANLAKSNLLDTFSGPV